MRKLITISSLLSLLLLLATPVFAQTAPATSGSVTQIVSFIYGIVQVLIAIAGIVSVGFFVKIITLLFKII